jgi:aerobic-type carbon monoxide dehydrogenase small subunit (CoxS/CutS family)
MDKKITLTIDGREHAISADPAMPLLYALRNDCGKRGPRFGCGLAQCGACTVLVGNAPVRSCVLPLAAVSGPIRTLDGLASGEEPHPVQAAFIAEEAGQCGYCLSGWIMTATALLEENPQRSDDEIRAAFSGLKCRCGTHMAILRAVRRAADTMAARQDDDRAD